MHIYTVTLYYYKTNKQKYNVSDPHRISTTSKNLTFVSITEFTSLFLSEAMVGAEEVKRNKA